MFAFYQQSFRQAAWRNFTGFFTTNWKSERSITSIDQALEVPLAIFT